VAATGRPIRVEVDGQLLEVLARPDRPGQYDFAWVSGAEPGLRIQFGSFRRVGYEHGRLRERDPRLSR
jgi:hypothetical protein